MIVQAFDTTTFSVNVNDGYATYNASFSRYVDNGTEKLYGIYGLKQY